jgi:proteasome lid subunit RPN8/RPN11
MGRKKKESGTPPDAPGPARGTGAPAGDDPASEDSRLSVGGWKRKRSIVHKEFPGPRGADAPLRIAMEREAYVELTAHAKEHPAEEVCGVLVGEVGEDDEGLYVHVQQVIRGEAARQGSAHVTFTQDTWVAIHKAMDRLYPKLSIVGWYHSHPGFGVEFSEMDLFIQRNFFPHPTQIALLTDPLGGEMAVCVNSGDGIQQVGTFWVDGRAQRCVQPRSRPSRGEDAGGIQADLLVDRLEALESRLSQVRQTVEELRRTVTRWVVFAGMLACTALLVWIGVSVYRMIIGPTEPPELLQYVPVPVKIGNKLMLVGVGVVNWNVPDDLNPYARQPDGRGSPKPAEPKKPEKEGTPAAKKPPGPSPQSHR